MNAAVQGSASDAASQVQEAATQPVLIIGTERSGSNLLRLVLNAHSRIAIPHPPHLVHYLAPIAHSYGDLTAESNRRRLVHDALTLTRRHIYPWPHPMDAEKVVALASPSLFGVVAAIYEQYRQAEGKARWGCKSTFMVDHVAAVLAEYPDARLVWLVRDPRDVAASAKRSVFGWCHPCLTARLWAEQQARALAAWQRHGPRTVHLLRYEDLVSKPEREVPRLCEFLGEPMEPAMLLHHDTDDARELAAQSESWRNAGRPIGTRSIGTHRSRLTARERALVEAIAGDLMRQIGYPAGTARPDRSTLPAWLPLRELWLRMAVEARSVWADRNVLRRWRRDATVRRLRWRARSRLLRTAMSGNAPRVPVRSR